MASEKLSFSSLRSIAIIYKLIKAEDFWNCNKLDTFNIPFDSIAAQLIGNSTIFAN